VDGKGFKAVQSIIHLSEAGGLFQRVARLLERRSLSSPDMDFREMGALIYVFKDRTAQTRTFTSNLYNEIHGELHNAAIRRSRILKELDLGLRPKAIVHMHTHPGPEYRPEDERNMTMLMNERDLSCYQSLSAFFSAYAGKKIPLIGVVRPVGETCGNVLITTEIGPYDASGDVRRLGKAMRALKNPS
jgi:hypothetical protein